MRKQSLLLFLGLVLTLAACSTDVFLQQQPYRVRLEPPQLGYEVDDQEKTAVVSNTAYVEVAPGAPEGYLDRYEYRVVDDSGNEVAAGSSLGSGFVGVRVPPGYEEVERWRGKGVLSPPRPIPLPLAWMARWRSCIPSRGLL